MHPQTHVKHGSKAATDIIIGSRFPGKHNLILNKVINSQGLVCAAHNYIHVLRLNIFIRFSGKFEARNRPPNMQTFLFIRFFNFIIIIGQS